MTCSWAHQREEPRLFSGCLGGCTWKLPCSPTQAPGLLTHQHDGAVGLDSRNKILPRGPAEKELSGKNMNADSFLEQHQNEAQVHPFPSKRDALRKSHLRSHSTHSGKCIPVGQVWCLRPSSLVLAPGWLKDDGKKIRPKGGCGNLKDRLHAVGKHESMVLF